MSRVVVRSGGGGFWWIYDGDEGRAWLSDDWREAVDKAHEVASAHEAARWTL